MGSGNDELGMILITNYLKLINEDNETPKFIVLYNSGVQLVCAGSPVIDLLKSIESKEVKIIACTTCLKYFNLMDSLKVGVAGTMMDILELQKMAGKIVTI